jgi:hypothetical protein
MTNSQYSLIEEFSKSQNYGCGMRIADDIDIDVKYDRITVSISRNCLFGLIEVMEVGNVAQVIEMSLCYFIRNNCI